MSSVKAEECTRCKQLSAGQTKLYYCIAHRPTPPEVIATIQIVRDTPKESR